MVVATDRQIIKYELLSSSNLKPDQYICSSRLIYKIIGGQSDIGIYDIPLIITGSPEIKIAAFNIERVFDASGSRLDPFIKNAYVIKISTILTGVSLSLHEFPCKYILTICRHSVCIGRPIYTTKLIIRKCTIYIENKCALLSMT